MIDITSFIKITMNDDYESCLVGPNDVSDDVNDDDYTVILMYKMMMKCL